jgi:hypothetical protein
VRAVDLVQESIASSQDRGLQAVTTRWVVGVQERDRGHPGLRGHHDASDREPISRFGIHGRSR